jgi:hypothetical protein
MAKVPIPQNTGGQATGRPSHFLGAFKCQGLAMGVTPWEHFFRIVNKSFKTLIMFVRRRGRKSMVFT